MGSGEEVAEIDEFAMVLILDYIFGLVYFG
jgi:hypothetical protein